ncbi:MAG TPA: PfkB family carbohydrate kinase [Geothermobacteraceae bacterium]|nr:PfkB family carbohydrate kinase [Geothermobacteraceae bacterium]
MIEKPVVGLGQCSWDLLGRVAEYPRVDVKAELLDLTEQGGGPVATALVTLQRLGVQTSFFGTIGDDDYGKRIVTSLVAAGVDTKYVQVDREGASQLSFIAVEQLQGRRNIFCHRGARRPFCLDAQAFQAVSAAAALLLDGTEPAAALEAASLARACQVPVVLDGGTLRDGVWELLPHCDHLIVSRKFADQICPGQPDVALDRLLEFGVEVAVVTLGASGCLALDRTGVRSKCPAFKVDVVDTTGCGDVFHGGYLYALLTGLSLPERLLFAAACAALKARQLGGRQGIPSLAEVERLLAS